MTVFSGATPHCVDVPLLEMYLITRGYGVEFGAQVTGVGTCNHNHTRRNTQYAVIYW